MCQFNKIRLFPSESVGQGPKAENECPILPFLNKDGLFIKEEEKVVQSVSEKNLVEFGRNSWKLVIKKSLKICNIP